MIDGDLRRRAEAWADDDPDPATAATIRSWLAVGDGAALARGFGPPLRFGTAGLRGVVGPGPSAMNRATVRRATAGLCRWLDASGVEGPVVIGRDARHGSEAFADEAAGVVAGSGRPVHVFAEPVPTPVVAFAVGRLGAAAGIVVTASHNPGPDNGYKVFAADGAQIVAPMDGEIASHMAAVLALAEVPVAHERTVVDASMLDAYIASAASRRVSGAVPPKVVVHTALHGVGGALLAATLVAAGYAAPLVVAEQADPDPDFPTVAFPNPEEPGAMDAVLALAVETRADLVLANDPDADRLAVAVPDAGGFRVLTGDEVGILLADHLLHHDPAPPTTLASTVVSSSMLADVAAATGVSHVETLTGFKWLARAAPAASLYAYEEALGYAVHPAVRDKDGIAAAVVMVDVAGALAAAGSSITGRLAELAVAHGLRCNRQRSVRLDETAPSGEAARRMADLRAGVPTVLAGEPVVDVEDLAAGDRLPPTDALVLRTAGERVIVRPSGTEPKVKVYVEVVRSVASVGEEPVVRAAAARRADAVLDDVARLLR